MDNRKNRRYYLLACLMVLLLGAYPLYMGGRVLVDMIAHGTVMKENYPKYIIPYTPIAVAVLAGVALMPLFRKASRKYALALGSVVALGLFFALELLLERTVVVTATQTVVALEDWQMYMCYIPSESVVTTYKTQTPVEILMGEYNPAFKLHFYLISVVLILCALNCLYGFGEMIGMAEKKRRKSLILQSVSTASFLGLCILACFTAFWRDGSLRVSPLSAGLMALFFILFGVTAGIFVGSFLLGRRKLISIWVSALTASAMTLAMYIGETILLNGHVYRFGEGFFFDPILGVGLAPVDILIVIAAGIITALLFFLLCAPRRKAPAQP